MPSCTSLEPLFTPYVDGELSPADVASLERHLAACPSCHSRAAAERIVRDLLHDRKAPLTDACAPLALRARCAQAANAWPGASAGAAVRGAWRGRLAPLVAAASLVLAVGGSFLYQATARSPRLMAAELAADHVKCFAMNAVLGTQDSSGVVESSLASGFGWVMQLPANADREGLELVGSRPCLYGEGKIAHIMYRHNGRPLSLFMLPRSERSEETLEVLGHECAIWSAGDRTFVLVSREARSEVEHLAAFVHGAMH